MAIMKKILTALSLSALLLVTGCSTPAPAGQNTDGGATGEQAQPEVQEAPAAPVDLTGTWKQTNSADEERYQEAEISGDTMTINWISPDTRSLYWAGTYVAPTEPGDSHTWESENDTSQTDTALLASTSATKEFSYENGVLSYEVSALGTTTIVKLEKQ